VLVTGHRRENVGAGLDRICDALVAVATRGDVDIAYPVHLNPAVRRTVRDRLSGATRIHLLDPVDHMAMVWLMGRAALLLTDSGGLQEEGPALGKPVLVMRDVTERPEALATGLVRLVGTDPARIEAAAAAVLDAAAPLPGPAFPFGDGHAARRIADAVEDWLARR
jgi:UDP-N-acetylglucosamine 2-epimerase (non-hydrolysing)